jgi:hypothetical protein
MKKPPTPKLVTVAIFTTITIVFWIFFGVYRILTAKPEVKIPPELLEQIVPELDTNTLEKLQERTFIKEGEEKPLSVNVTTPKPAEKILPTPTAKIEE